MFAFHRRVLGIDIADHSLEVVELAPGPTLVSVGRVRLRAGVVERGRLKDAAQMSAALREALQSAKPPITARSAVVGVPDSQVYVRVAPVGVVDDLAVTVQRSVEQSIPIPADDAVWSYQVVATHEHDQDVCVVATSLSVLKEWQAFFKSQQIEVRLFDPEPLAIVRGLFAAAAPTMPTLVADLGSRTSSLYLYDKEGLRYSVMLNVAGEALTQSLTQALGVPEDEAERLKTTAGLSEESAKQFSTLIKTLEPLQREVDTALKYAAHQLSAPVQEIILVGGTSRLPGLAEYLNVTFDVPVRLGEPGGVRGVDKKTFRLKGKAMGSGGSPVQHEPYFVEAVGLAMRGLHGGSELAFMPPSEKKSRFGLPARSQSSSSVAAKNANPALAKQKMVLMGVLLLGMVAIGAAVAYQRSVSAPPEKPPIEMGGFVNTQKIEVVLAGATAPDQYKPDRVRAWIATEEPELRDEEAAVAFGENQWLIYRVEDLNRLTLEDINRRNTGNKRYVLDTLVVSGVEMTATADVVTLVVAVTLGVDEQIAFAEQSAPVSVSPAAAAADTPIASAKIFLTIANTPTGWVNVRADAGTSYAVIGRVNAGEEYELLQESSGWYKIAMKDGAMGWITAQYATKK